MAQRRRGVVVSLEVQAILSILAERYNPREGVARPGTMTLLRDAGIASKNRARRLLREAVTVGAVEVRVGRGRGRATEVRFTDAVWNAPDLRAISRIDHAGKGFAGGPFSGREKGSPVDPFPVAGSAEKGPLTIEKRVRSCGPPTERGTEKTTLSANPGADGPRAPRKDPDLRLQARRVFAYWRVVAERKREMPTERDLRTIEKRLREEAAKGASEPWRVLAAAVEGAALHQFARPNGTTWRAIATIKGTFGTTDRVRECLDLWRQAGKPVTAEAFAAADGEAPDRRDDEAVIETAAGNPTPRESETTHREDEGEPTTVTASRPPAESEDPGLRRRRLEVDRLRSEAA